ncbi:MAG: hypothetical protein OXU45_02415, partial [Candidatus Melainabacteria bacterium]|nr:hypothetical protein [Candidatus Melainabacteria bacterium]
MCGYDPKHQFANFIFIEPKYKEVKAELLKSRDKIATLEKDIENLGNNNLEMIKYVSETIDTIADSALKGIGEKLKLSTDERLSLYIHNDVSQFTIVGRYSPNKKYDRRNRATFCDEQGCIGNAWDKGVCFEPSLPKDKTIRNGLFKKKYNVPIKVSKTLKMPSKFYYCKRID